MSNVWRQKCTAAMVGVHTVRLKECDGFSSGWEGGAGTASVRNNFIEEVAQTEM